ncbi:phosphomannomutase/phosphoglucomutase [Devriesea agamarum]|uniref:phosphomannomutase/phosphoglucomutase n=1 Tax=Devriesea agamarum TaxID=472569 RepID=UPI000AF4C753|nr:phosphomannomutase/phosphoglucomutase [Devriesea agamarum]
MTVSDRMREHGTAHTSRAVDLSALVKAYDVRGHAQAQFTAEVAEAFGAACVDELRAERSEHDADQVLSLLVGHDMRVSSPTLSDAFARGAARRGAQVIEIGLCSTDQLYCASGRKQLPGVMFTASHNPAPDNGMKMCRAGVRPIGRDTGLAAMRDRAEDYLRTGVIDQRGEGSRLREDTLSDYVDTVCALVPIEGRRPVRVVVDAANAMAGLTVPAVAERLPFLTVIPLYFDLDGTFPNHEANPLDPKNLVDLQAAVREHGADLGLAFDGDADRCFIVDEQGNAVSASAITALIATREIERAREQGEDAPAVVANLVSSRHVSEAIHAAGGRHVRSRVGHSLIKALMAQNNAVFGGEHSAHYYFRDFYFADSGMLAALHVLAALVETDGPVSQLLAEHSPYVASGELNSRVADVHRATEAVRRAFASVNGVEFDDLDGMTVTRWDDENPRDDDWWFSLRASNTEPLLRLNVEARNERVRDEIRDQVLDIVRA